MKKAGFYQYNFLVQTGMASIAFFDPLNHIVREHYIQSCKINLASVKSVGKLNLRNACFIFVTSTYIFSLNLIQRENIR